MKIFKTHIFKRDDMRELAHAKFDPKSSEKDLQQSSDEHRLTDYLLLTIQWK